jgi:hypothetical protein
MITARTTDGSIVQLPDEEAHRIHREMEARTPQPHKGMSAQYATKTRELMRAAQVELDELTGDYPENMMELYDFAVKHELFGDRDDTHLTINFFKVLYALLQGETHA